LVADGWAHGSKGYESLLAAGCASGCLGTWQRELLLVLATKVNISIRLALVVFSRACFVGRGALGLVLGQVALRGGNSCHFLLIDCQIRLTCRSAHCSRRWQITFPIHINDIWPTNI